MVRLSPIDPSAPPTIPPGAAVRLRPVTDWAGTDPGDRPLACEFEEAGSGPRRFHWTADLAGEPCRCDVLELVNLGCQPACGRFAREMAAR